LYLLYDFFTIFCKFLSTLDLWGIETSLVKNFNCELEDYLVKLKEELYVVNVIA
jgi:hypothetical protein